MPRCSAGLFSLNIKLLYSCYSIFCSTLGCDIQCSLVFASFFSLHKAARLKGATEVSMYNLQWLYRLSAGIQDCISSPMTYIMVEIAYQNSLFVSI